MSNVEPTMDILDGSDVDEDNVGDVDQDAENVLLGSDDEETHPTQFSRSPGASYAGKYALMENRGHQSEEEEDVLNLVLQGDEETLDFDETNDGNHKGRVPPVKIRNSVISTEREFSQNENESEQDNDGSHDVTAATSKSDEGTESFNDRVVEDEDHDDGDGDDESEARNTRSRFTTERNVESFNGGNAAGSSSSSVGIPIQTVGERKVRPGIPENRPKHWNHNGPRPAGPRHPGRNHRFPNPRPGPLMHKENPQNRTILQSPPVVQFNEGLFTDFNQPLRHPHPHHRPRQPPPNGRFEPPRNLEQQGHRHPMPPPNIMNNMNNNFPPPLQQNMRPPFFPHENNMGHPRPHMPGNHRGHPPQQPPPRPDFNLRPQQRPPRFPPNQRNPRPPHMANPNHMQHHERQQFPPRPLRPPFRPEFPPHDPMGMNARPPNPHGFPPPPHPNMQGFIPPQMSGNSNAPARFMGPPQDHNNPFFMQQSSGSNFHPPQEPAPYQHQQNIPWGGGPAEHVPHQGNNPSPWMQQQQQPQQNFQGGGYGPDHMYEQSPPRPANPIIMHPNLALAQSALPLSLHTSVHQLEIPHLTTKSIYIKPNSEIHEALSKGGHFRSSLKPKEHSRERETSSSRHYDDYRDYDRSSRRRSSSPPPPSNRRRDDDDYYDERKSYHSNDRRSRRKYEHDRKDRSESPEKKIGRSDVHGHSHSHDRERERESDNKDAVKLLEEAKKMGLGEDYVRKLEEQRKLRERILKTKEQRRKLVKVVTPGGGETTAVVPDNTKGSHSKDKILDKRSGLSKSSAGNVQRSNAEKVKEIEADSTVASGKAGKSKKILRIVRDKSGKIISKKVHVVLVAKPQQDGQQSTSTA